MMDNFYFLSKPDETNVAQILRDAGLPELGADLQVTHLGGRAYEVGTPAGDWIARFPGEASQLAMLEKETRLWQGMRARVRLAVPETRLIASGPVFALHRKIPGVALTGEMYAAMDAAARDRLVGDLAAFFRDCHGVPLAAAGAWLGENGTAEEWAVRRGTPLWFAEGELPRIRAGLAGKLSAAERGIFETVVSEFAALPRRADWMVFGHGDLHGFNMAMLPDAQGDMRIHGVFDLGCAGILDVHEDFFRLGLVSRDLLERVVGEYQRLGGQVQRTEMEGTRALESTRVLSRTRVYYQAFLFYLMADQEGDRLEHLRTML